MNILSDTAPLDLETDVSKVDTETDIKNFCDKNIHTNADKVEEKLEERLRDYHVGSNCSSSRIRGGRLPELLTSTPPLSHSLSTSCLNSINNPTPSSQEHLCSKNQEEAHFDNNRERRGGTPKKSVDHFHRGMKKGRDTVTATSFSSTGSSIQSPEMYQNQCQVIKSLISCDLDIIELKDDGEAARNQFLSNNSGSAPGPVCRTDGVDKLFDILVVDDSKLNRKMLCKILRSKGHLCDEADDG